VRTIDPERPYTITGAPRIAKGRVVIGNGGAEYGVRGYVSAYDAETGERLWRFHTVPGDPALGFESAAMQRAAATWHGKWWEVGGGGTVWDSMAYDPELDLLYIGVGNGSPWSRRLRSEGKGDNLFLASIVALRPETGEYVWHYQTTPGETWDYTATQHMILTELEIDGRERKVLMQAPKNGFFYVIDRETGELISAERYVDINWATHVDPVSGRPVEIPEARAIAASSPVAPAAVGGHNWQPMAFHPKTGLVYVPAIRASMLAGTAQDFEYEPGFWNLGIPKPAPMPIEQVALQVVTRALMRGHLLAWDPVAQREAWRVEHSTMWNGGVLSTAGNLVFQGTGDGRFVAYRADDGERLWDFDVQTGVIAPPITYELDGEQYVAVLVGWGGAGALMMGPKPTASPPLGRLLAFKLDADGRLPGLDPLVLEELSPPPLTASTAEVERGFELYHTYCHMCHGVNAGGNGVLPDLRLMTAERHEAFDAIVLDGALRGTGMRAFRGPLDEEGSAAIHAFLVERAHAALADRETPTWWLEFKRSVYGWIAPALAWMVGV